METYPEAQNAAGPAGPDWPAPAPVPPAGYLDAVAGQPVLPIARQALVAALEQGWSDPARLHHTGRRAGLVLDTARAAIAGFLGVPSAECFLGSSTADLMRAAIVGLYSARTAAGAPRRIVISSVESMAVRFAAQACPGAEVVDIDVDELGCIDSERYAAELTAGAALACVQLANAETGTVQPSASVHDIAADLGIPVVRDATQVAGHMEIGPDWDILVANPRDWAAPSGVAVLVVGSGIRWRPPQAPDRGWVGGFPDVPAAAGAAAAAEYLQPLWRSEAARHRALTANIREVVAQLPGVRCVGDPDQRLPHVLTFIAEDAVGERIVTELDRLGYAAASGSACTADATMPSYVLEAMGITTNASVRIALPFGCTDETVEGFLSALPAALTQARA